MTGWISPAPSTARNPREAGELRPHSSQLSLSIKLCARYAPVLELNDRTDVDVYFPDGTFCHSEGETDYFCRKHRCLSSARGGRYEVVPDLDVNGNARPDGKLSVPSDAEAYFSLDSNVRTIRY